MPLKTFALASFSSVFVVIFLSSIIVTLFVAQRNAEEKVSALVDLRTDALADKPVDLDWTRPEVLLRSKENRSKVIRRRNSLPDVANTKNLYWGKEERRNLKLVPIFFPLYFRVNAHWLRCEVLSREYVQNLL